MKGFPDEVKRDIFECQNGICRVLNCYEPIVDFHHKLSQSKVNKRLYPLFINSPFNCVGLCRDCHTNRSHLFRVTEKEAEIYERFLNQNKND